MADNATVSSIIANIDKHFVDLEQKTLDSIKTLRDKAGVRLYSVIDEGNFDTSGQTGNDPPDTKGATLIGDFHINDEPFPKLDTWKPFKEMLTSDKITVDNVDVLYDIPNFTDIIDFVVDTNSIKPPRLSTSIGLYRTRIWNSAILDSIERSVVSLLNGTQRSQYQRLVDRAAERSNKIYAKMLKLIPTYIPENITRSITYNLQTVFSDYVNNMKFVTLQEAASKDLEWAIKMETDIDQAHVNYCTKYTEIMLRVQEYILKKQLTETELLFKHNEFVYDNALTFIEGATSLYMDATEKNMFAVIEETREQIEVDKLNAMKLLEKYKTEAMIYEKENTLIELKNKYGIENYGMNVRSLLKDSEARMETKVTEAKNAIAALSVAADAYVGLINTATQSVVGVVKE